MKTKANAIRLQFTESGATEIILTTTENKLQVQQEVKELKEIIEKGKQLSVEIKQYRQKRSLDANGYMWVLLSEMAAILHTTKDELYLIMLERYGVFTHIIVRPNVVDKVKQEWRTVRVLGEIDINDKIGIQIQCFFGSSTYNTKEMSRLIEGVVSEAQELGIDTMTENERLSMISEWRNIA